MFSKNSSCLHPLFFSERGCKGKDFFLSRKFYEQNFVESFYPCFPPHKPTYCLDASNLSGLTPGKHFLPIRKLNALSLECGDKSSILKHILQIF